MVYCKNEKLSRPFQSVWQCMKYVSRTPNETQREISGCHGVEYEGDWLPSAMFRRIVWYKFTDVSEALAAIIIIALMM
jgi:hypothetical protein